MKIPKGLWLYNTTGHLLHVTTRISTEECVECKEEGGGGVKEGYGP